MRMFAAPEFAALFGGNTTCWLITPASATLPPSTINPAVAIASASAFCDLSAFIFLPPSLVDRLPGRLSRRYGACHRSATEPASECSAGYHPVRTPVRLLDAPPP